MTAEIPEQPIASAASGTALLRITLDLMHRQLHDVNFSADPVKSNVAVILLRVKLQSKMNLPAVCLKCKAACPVG